MITSRAVTSLSAWAFMLPFLLLAPLQAVIAEDVDPKQVAFEKRATAYGQEFAGEVEDGRLDLFRHTFDQAGYIDRVTEGLLLNAEDRAALPAVLRSDRLWDPVLDALRQGLGSFRFLGLRRIDGETVALFRLTALPNIVTWQALLLREDPSGKLRAVDIYDYGDGLWNSASVRRELVANIPELDPNPDPLKERHAADYAAAVQRFLAGKFEAGEAYWKKLPEALQRERFLMRWRVGAARVYSKPAYAQAIRDYRSAYPGDPYLVMREKDLAYIEGRWEDVLRQVDVVDRYLGGDPFVASERAVALEALGRHAEAARVLDEAIVAAGPLQELLLVRAICALAMKDFGKATEMLRIWEERTGRQVRLGPPMENLEAFRHSESYRRWRGESAPAPASPKFQGDLLSFARALEKELIERKLDLFLGSCDYDAMTDQALAGLQLTDADRATARRSIANSPEFAKVIEQLMRLVLGEGGRFHFLRLSQHQQRKIALYRIAGHGMTAWFGMQLMVASDGTVRVVDVFNYANGSWVSEGIRREVVFQHPYAAGKEAGDMRAFNETYGRMLSAFGDLRYAEGMLHYQRLPAAWQRRRDVLEARVHAARHASEAEYQEALQALLQHHPGDVGGLIKAIELELIRGRHEEALAAIEALDKAIGRDPFLDVRRAEVHVRAGRTAKARALATAFLEAEGPLADAYVVLAECAVAKGDFALAVGHYGRASTMRTNPIEPSEQVPGSAAFLASPEYKRWQARLELSGGR